MIIISERNTGLEIIRLSNIIKRLADRNIDNSDLSNATYGNGKILGFVYRHKNRDIFQKDIEEAFSLAPSTVSTILKHMETHNMIVRCPVDYDARLKKISLTEKSRTILDKITEKNRDLEKKIIQDFTDEDILRLHEYLQKIMQNLKKEGI